MIQPLCAARTEGLLISLSKLEDCWTQHISFLRKGSVFPGITLNESKKNTRLNKFTRSCKEPSCRNLAINFLPEGLFHKRQPIFNKEKIAIDEAFKEFQKICEQLSKFLEKKVVCEMRNLIGCRLFILPSMYVIEFHFNPKQL